MSEENPFDKIMHIPLDKVREILNRTNLERQVFNEIVGDNWKVKIIETKVNKNNYETIYRLYGIYLGDKSVAVSVTSDGKLRHIILNDVKVVSETDQTVKKKNTMLLLDYENQRAVFTEGEMELWKGKTGFDAIKSINILKNESRDLQ
ncbi:hypothetical protein [Saccharolobus islandicus]|uniref:Uncharacterized protein n=3 Tax=Saccharolobus islandicus TaxID=43080 RepID=M9U5D8_SACIS|nr:hypothetical protein [Sulfolobus islandicus]ADX81955.1 conserved hypothetical protein [Sulfolobus islandicus HVE10/4]ADX84831.1 conserved hypothetical protein [Sulfolobus islandicus REY15A]AGJ62224.1 Hypothetical Protein SiL_0766 [Sulfolobus islandicus LAL14/1]WCM36698.1 hypothetical protein GO599_03780 [Sulfolobus islandicus]